MITYVYHSSPTQLNQLWAMKIHLKDSQAACMKSRAKKGINMTKTKTQLYSLDDYMMLNDIAIIHERPSIHESMTISMSHTNVKPPYITIESPLNRYIISPFF